MDLTGRARSGLNHTLVAGSLAAAAVLALAPSGADAANKRTRSWYVQAGGSADGDGSRRAPFGRLALVEAVSRAGDRIVVVPAARSAGALDGGIQLKARQRLVGAGPAVGAEGTRDLAPRVTNTDGSRLNGDAVRLASATTVRNLEITGARRGAIYGLDVSTARVEGNDISGHNVSCVRGFHIPPFKIPLTVPLLLVPISDGLHNAWAAIQIDAGHGKGSVLIKDNRVHDADCGDGIDVRVAGDAVMRARITGNDVRNLRQGPGMSSILAIGLQTREDSRLVARLHDNRQSGIGNDEDIGIGPTGADTEGLFFNPVGPSSMRVTVSRNVYTHTPGRGGFSSNGLEFVSMGNGARALVDVRDSTFTGTPGDVIEQFGLGANSRLRMRLDRVTASRSTGLGGSGYGDTVVIPANNADCLVAASAGGGNVIDLEIRRSTFTNCANNGVFLGTATGNGPGPTSLMRVDIEDSRITGNRGANLRIANVADVEAVRVKVQRTNLSDSRGGSSTLGNVNAMDLGTRTGQATIDLGGGPLGSSGGNCLGGGPLAVMLLRYSVSARRNWWGRPGGAGLGRVIAASAQLDDGDALMAAPAAC